MIDFEKQPLCRVCPHCVGWALDYQECAEDMAYSPDGSCMAAAERMAQCKLDAQEYEGDDGYDYEDEEQEDGEDD